MKMIVHSEHSPPMKIAMRMDLLPETYFQGGHMHPGYFVPEALLPVFLQEASAQEYWMCAMYEGGDFQGCYYDSDDRSVLWTWAVMPESCEDARHIHEHVIGKRPAYANTAQTSEVCDGEGVRPVPGADDQRSSDARAGLSESAHQSCDG